MSRARLERVLFWTLPSLLCLWLYWYGLKAWFQQDDFAWLSLKLQVYDWPTFWKAMFEPQAQGTIRPWSERGFFLAFETLFGLDALPYRIAVFVTEAANIVLLSWIVTRVTGSRLAGFAAPLLWIANSGIAVPMTWTSDYNEILCALFLLSALALFVKFEETGSRKYYWLQSAVFVLGFGALELNIVYPALAASYALARRRKDLLLSSLPLFAISAAYYVLHSLAAPSQKTGPYALHFDLSIFQTLLHFWQTALIPGSWATVFRIPGWLPEAAAWFLSALLLGFTTHETLRRRWMPIFFLAWFLITLGPLLPLRDHTSDYYLTLPTIGIAAIGAIALATARGWAGRATAVAGILLYLAFMIPVTRFTVRWNYDRSLAVRNLVLGIRTAHQLHPDKTILLAGVDSDLYATAIAHSPFPLVGARSVYLTPDTSSRLARFSYLNEVSEYVLPPGPTLHGLAAGSIAVYEVGGERLRNITSDYGATTARRFQETFPRRVDVGSPLLAYLLGSTWYSLEGNHRWMPESASIRLGAPQSAEEKLILTGYCPEQLTRSGPVTVTVSVDGKKVSETVFTKPESPFSRSISVPPGSVGQEHMDVLVEVSRTFRQSPGDRPLGLVFGLFEIRKP